MYLKNGMSPWPWLYKSNSVLSIRQQEIDCVQHRTLKRCCSRNRMNNLLVLLANEPPPRLVGSRYSRVIRCYSFQEILFEYCICLLLLVSVALVIFGVRFLRSETRGGMCSSDYNDGILVSLRRLWSSKSLAKYTAVDESAYQMSEDEVLQL